MTRFKAIIFDVDGTLAETEEVHRAAFNETFARFGLDWNWDEALYRDLLKTTGGKERLRHYSERCGTHLSDGRIAEMHVTKNERYAELVSAGACILRPGVEHFIRMCEEAGLRLAIATTTSHPNVDALLSSALSPGGRRCFEVVVAGDDVPRKKPAPDVYISALNQLRLAPEACLAIEDSANGVASARDAGLEVWATPSLYSSHESFDAAHRVLKDLSQVRTLS